MRMYKMVCTAATPHPKRKTKCRLETRQVQSGMPMTVSWVRTTQAPRRPWRCLVPRTQMRRGRWRRRRLWIRPRVLPAMAVAATVAPGQGARGACLRSGVPTGELAPPWRAFQLPLLFSLYLFRSLCHDSSVRLFSFRPFVEDVVGFQGYASPYSLLAEVGASAWPTTSVTVEGAWVWPSLPGPSGRG